MHSRKSNWCRSIVFILLFVSTYTWAGPDIDVSDFSQEQIAPKKSPEVKPSPFSFNVEFDAIGKAKIREGFFKKDEIEFTLANFEFEMVYYYNKPYQEGANVVLGYQPTRITWDGNPWFDQSFFNTVTLNFGFLTKRFSDWAWRGQFGVYWDIGKGCMSAEYFNYNLILWGRYAFCKNFGFHLGFIGETGMRMDRVYPIIGIDWAISNKWQLNLIFPLDFSIVYQWTKKWSLAIASSNFNSRHRVQQGEANAGYVVRYQNVGGEFAVRYETQNLSGNLHAGTTLGGYYRVANNHNHHPHRYKLDPAGYVGGEVQVRF